MNSFQIIVPDETAYDADLNVLMKYSKYYEKGFSGCFAENKTSYLEEHATPYTVEKFIAIVTYLEAEENDPNYMDQFPLDWFNDEEWDDLFQLWMLSDFLLAARVIEFIEEYMIGKAKWCDLRKGTELEKEGQRHKLGLDVINKIWSATLPGYHDSIRRMMVSVVAESEDFKESQTKRDGILDQLPADAQRAVAHELFSQVCRSRDAVEEAVGQANSAVLKHVPGDQFENHWWQAPLTNLCTNLGMRDFAETLWHTWGHDL